MASVVRGTSLRAGGACVRCRKGKTKCVYENGRAPCKNCAKGMHECYLPSEQGAHHHGQSPARVPRPRESLPGERSVSSTAERQGVPATAAARHAPSSEKLTSDLLADCERVINKVIPACVAFHKPSFLQHLKNGTLEPSIINGLLTIAARSSPNLVRRYGGVSGVSGAADHFAVKTVSLVMQNLDNPSLADIQAICLLVIHEWGSRQAVRAYIYLGQAARMVQMYRIINSHQTQNTNDADHFIKEESFRRTVWLIYILDCFLTSSPGRYPALSAQDIKDFSLPCPDMSFNFGTPAYVRTLNGTPPLDLPQPAPPLSEVGEFGHIVMATRAWRNVVEMLTTVTVETFSEQQCATLESEIENVRSSLPMHFLDKPGHINLHITMGSGYTYALLHCLLHCATIQVNRRRLLQIVTSDKFNIDGWRMSPQSQLQIVDRVLAASHSLVSLLLALEGNRDKDAMLCFPLIMLFSCFTACSTVAYFSLKSLAPLNVAESSASIVRDGMRFLEHGAEAWTLAIPWYRHLGVMQKVLSNTESASKNEKAAPTTIPIIQKDETSSQTGQNGDSMDYERTASAPPPPPAPQQPSPEGRGSEPPIARRPGLATINGGSVGAPTPVAATPPPAPQPPTKAESPNSAYTGEALNQVPLEANISQVNDMTAAELCEAFENQLLELDDLAAFMGGGV